jgi:release factor glutamine methyltransferase
LLQNALQRSKTWVLSHGEYTQSVKEYNTLQKYLSDLLQGVPLPHILGQWDFFNRTFLVSPDVLIPRPETELLVEKAFYHARRFEHPSIIDVGTGSGAIAVTLAAELPTAKIFGIDLSMAALQIAQKNAHRLCEGRVNFVQTDLLISIEAKFDLICANLPYIPRQLLPTLSVAQWEPNLALDGGESGLEVIGELLKQAQTRLSPTGMILLETEASLGAETRAAAQAAFPNARHQLFQDLEGRDRIVEICQN